MDRVIRNQKKQKKLRRKRDAKKRYKEFLIRKKNKLKLQNNKKMYFYKMPDFFPDNVQKETRINVMREIGKKAKNDFTVKYPLILKWFGDYDALYLLSFFSFYFMSFQEGAHPEADGKIEIYQYHIELMQAFSLVQPRVVSTKFLLQNAECLKNDLKDISQLIKMRFFDIPEEIKDDKDFNSFILRVDMMENTIAVRNWAYPYQIKRVVCELSNLIKNDYEKIFDIDIEKLIISLLNLPQRCEDLLNEHISKIHLFAKKDHKEMIESYQKSFSHLINMDNQGTDEIWKMCGNDLKNLRSMLMCYADLSLEKIYTFSLDDIVFYYGDESKKEIIRNILCQMAYKFGDLKDANLEYFILDNPIHTKPFIDLGNDQFYTAISGSLFHIIMQIFENLISQNEELNNKYNTQIKSKYLEDEIEHLFRLNFPTANVYRGSQWFNDEGNILYENDLIVIIDTFAIIIEAKSGRITNPAKRGAPERLFETLKELIEEPSEQAYRFKTLLKNKKQVHSFKNKSGQEYNIDSSKIHYYIPLSITLAQLGNISSNLKKMIAAGITEKNIKELSPSISLTDIELIFELLPLEAEKIHYFARRKEIEEHLNYEGDEIDLLSFYLEQGFNIGEAEYSGDMHLNMVGKSFDLDPFFIDGNKGINVSKPELSMSMWWKDILNQIHKRKPTNWLETAYILLNSTKEDQVKFVNDIEILKDRIKKGQTEKPHNWVRFLSGPPERRYSIIGYVYTTDDKEIRNNMIKTILHGESIDGIRGVVVIGIDLNRSDYPYSVLAGKLDNNLF
ncbi:MAG: hypothetical protein PHR82_10225 [Endomicrobiaceae bacterium]|nr:hypothetical protein [Endomicrobiaceae bacterium]